MSTNTDISQLFEQTADVMAILGANSFRVLATRKVARLLHECPRSVEELAGSGELDNMPGIGKHSAEKIREYLRTGHIGEFQELVGQVPPGVLGMMNISGVGVKSAALFWREAGITTIEELRQRLDDGSLLNLPGMGAKKLAKIKENLAFSTAQASRQRLGEALPIAREFCQLLQTIPAVRRTAFCGSLRRGRETIGDIDILVCSDADVHQQIHATLGRHRPVAAMLAVGEKKVSFRTDHGLQVDIRVVPTPSWGAAMQYFTGSKEHNVRLRELAASKNLKLNEWGLFAGEKAIAGETEEDIYEALGLAWIPPEMREDRREVELAQLMRDHAKAELKATFPFLADAPCTWQTLQAGDIRGDLHTHTVASDGTRTIAEMVAAAKRLGYEYIAITDHSKSQIQANGLNPQRLLEHIAAIHAVARDVQGIRVLAGAEVDILADGTLDYEDDLLQKLDWVVASPHAALTQEADAATARLVRAAAHPLVHVLGHPTGRLVAKRRGLEPDMPRVVMAALRSGVALEINANDMRLDLRDTHVRLAVEAGVPLCINTDAHSIEDFTQMDYGVLTARRGWARKANILNTRSGAELEQWIQARRNTDE
ncbi:MAG: DNA polymerase/3'-5' exonuclease PolX [Phycisphaerae bacterium]|nr:DNA polymerase/3'-5' exonuclease PolX [Phycisphaerae bacterium]